MTDQGKNRAPDPLGSVLRDHYRAEIIAHRNRVPEASAVWLQAQATSRLAGPASTPPLLWLHGESVMLATAGLLLAVWWGEATEGVAQLLAVSGARLDEFWNSRISEIVVGTPLALIRSLLH